MKRLIFSVALLCLAAVGFAQLKPFRFAFISDTHIGSPDGKAEEDLRRTIDDINQMNDIAFVVITGDITELGTNEELARAKNLLSGLKVPYHIIPGNHDTGWSESGGVSFISTFGSDRFSFEYSGIRFIGCASGPYVRMSDGHVPRSAINWLDQKLAATRNAQPLIFLNHYPIDSSLDNWYEITDRLRRYNTLAILCGHGHANRAMNFEDIPGVMGRSNLRARQETGGYNLVDVSADSLVFTERKPVLATSRRWTAVPVKERVIDPNKKFARPSYAINGQFSGIKEKWRFVSPANVISTPAVHEDNVIVGNQDGIIYCLSYLEGKEKWKFSTGGAIFSSPVIVNGLVIFGSGDGHVYCLNENTGKQRWKVKMDAAVLGSPVVADETVYIGGSDHRFVALELGTGRIRWHFDSLQGPVVSTPLLYDGRVLFGAWDRHLYCLDQATGQLNWKWNNGSSVRNFSPAACIPVAANGVVYVVAPDRYLSAIDLQDGHTLWRNHQATVRESIGLSADSNWIYGKTMQDTIVAYKTSREPQQVAWRMDCGFGYEHVPSMLIEKEGSLFFGTRLGVVYAIDPGTQTINWAHKIDNSMVNTVRVIDGKHVIASTMDGKVVLLEDSLHR